MATAAVVGCTGQVGSHILSTLLSLDTVKAVHTISRRTPKPGSSSGTSRKLSAHVESDTSKWASTLAAISPLPDVVFSALGTTREEAGGIANQWRIDHDLNVELSKSAHAHGIKSFIFVSCASTQGSLARLMPYLQMKQGVENAIRSLDFERAVVLRPGLILGDREQEHQGAPFLKSLISGIGGFSQAWHDNLGQEPDVIARVAVKAALFPDADNGSPGRYRIIERQEIVRLGRDE
ncbi:NAD(P)-binding domain protein [Apiospora saccharicola]|uniref:NAD(P)-binding domain protein n=1 Tax=Apiospora saccharicola TaxID=335842 RepID=A0ABR1U642_9PEZI